MFQARRNIMFFSSCIKSYHFKDCNKRKHKKSFSTFTFDLLELINSLWIGQLFGMRKQLSTGKKVTENEFPSGKSQRIFLQMKGGHPDP